MNDILERLKHLAYLQITSTSAERCVAMLDAASEISSLRAELSALKSAQGEPVGCMSREEFDRMTRATVENGECFRIWQMDNPPSRAKSGVKLYTTPQPAPAAVPDVVARDAERYRWLRENGKEMTYDALLEIIEEYGDRADAKLDAAILASQHRGRSTPRSDSGH